jgi:phage baseplate assembly protein W
MGLFLFPIYFLKIIIIIFIYKESIMAGNGKYININFPFEESRRGDFLKLNNDDRSAIKADLMHLLLTNKGERLYMPDFGTNLLQFIFEQNDPNTAGNIKKEINNSIKKYLPNLQVTEIVIEQSTESEYAVIIRIDYVVTEGVFQDTDFVIIQL